MSFYGYSNDEYKQWCRTTVAELKQMARQWEDITKVRGVDESGKAAYRDAYMTLEAFIERSKWINRKIDPVKK